MAGRKDPEKNGRGWAVCEVVENQALFHKVLTIMFGFWNGK